MRRGRWGTRLHRCYSVHAATRTKNRAPIPRFCSSSHPHSRGLRAVAWPLSSRVRGVEESETVSGSHGADSSG